MGTLIVIDGLDGTGKQTQIGLLSRRLEQEGLLHKTVAFPTYTKSSSLITSYLAGEYGGIDQVNVYAASAFYAVDRYASYAQSWGDYHKAGGLVLADRYATSNFIHQMGKLPQTQWEDYISWLEQLEYERFLLPRPDLVLFFALSPALAERLLLGRYGGDAARRDLHERDMNYLLQCCTTARFAAERLGWRVIPCENGAGEIRSVEDIGAEVQAAVLDYMALRASG